MLPNLTMTERIHPIPAPRVEFQTPVTVCVTTDPCQDHPVVCCLFIHFVLHHDSDPFLPLHLYLSSSSSPFQRLPTPSSL